MSTFTGLYDRFAAKLRFIGASLDVTRRTLSLGVADGETGWYAKSYANTTIEMVILGRAATLMLIESGLYVKRDAVGLTKTAVIEGDEVMDAASRYYTVESVTPHCVGDLLVFYECQLVYNAFHT